MLSVTVVLFRPKAEDFADAVASLLRNSNQLHAVHILVSGTLAEYESIEILTRQLSAVTSLFIHHRFDNLGFASGHNFLLEEAFAEGASAVLVLNPDVHIEEGALQRLPLLEIIRSEQPMLVAPTLRRATKLGELDDSFDSAGIAWTKSARHFDKLQGGPWKITDGQLDSVRGVTGACLVVAKNAYDVIRRGSGHFFDDLFLAYREDAELGIRAEQLGVCSYVLHTEGFSHIRTVRGYQRGNSLADLLGVRNRFLLRWSLGQHRPGNPLIASVRDLLVVTATLLQEKSSIPGLKGAYSIRRFSRNRGRSWRRGNIVSNSASNIGS